MSNNHLLKEILSLQTYKLFENTEKLVSLDDVIALINKESKYSVDVNQRIDEIVAYWQSMKNKGLDIPHGILEDLVSLKR